MAELANSMGSMKLVYEVESALNEQGDVQPIDKASVEEPVANNLSYLGRYLPHLIVTHPEWTIPQYYEHLATQEDFPCDGSVTRKALRQKVSKLRKKMQANGGYLVDPMDNTRVLQGAEGSCTPRRNEKSRADSSKEVKSSVKPKEEVPLKSVLDSVDTLGAMWVGFTFQGMLKEKGPKEGVATWIREMSVHVTMLRSKDGKEAARLLFSGLLCDEYVITTSIPSWVLDKVYTPVKTALGINDDDIQMWKAMKGMATKEKKKARSILENLVRQDEEETNQSGSRKKSLPYLQLASMYLNGSGGKRDMRKAEELYRIAADRGNSIAQHKLAYLAEQRGVKGKALKDLYKVGVDNDNADSMNNLALELLDEEGKTFGNCKEARELLQRGTELNTSTCCKGTFVKEMIGSGNMDLVHRKAWELVVAGDCANAGFYAGSQYLLQEKAEYNLFLGDALLRHSAERGCDVARQWLDRVKALRMKAEGRRYTHHISDDYIQKTSEWKEAEDWIYEDLSNSFRELLHTRIEECYLETVQRKARES